MADFFFDCPLCGAPLVGDKSLRCANGHCFDKAKSGYVNLLPPKKAAGKTHGDDKEMVLARSRFLAGGYYSFLKDAICDLALTLAPQKTMRLLDAGCGEGYYTNALWQALTTAQKQVALGGLDISKSAVAAASRCCPQGDFAVASSYHLPVAANSCHLVCSLFAPVVTEEFEKVLCPGGGLILAIPAQQHLLELKQLVYDDPYIKPIKPLELPGFALHSQTHLTQSLWLPNNQTVLDLFAMTPYSYKTSVAGQQRLKTVNTLAVTADFLLLGYKKL